MSTLWCRGHIDDAVDDAEEATGVVELIADDAASVLSPTCCKSLADLSELLRDCRAARRRATAYL